MAIEIDEDILLKVVCEVWVNEWETTFNEPLPIYVYETRDDLKLAIELYLEKTGSKIVSQGTYE